MREDRKRALFTNMALAVGLSLLVFVAGVDNTGNDGACGATPVFTLLFVLASFAWLVVITVVLTQLVSLDYSIMSRGTDRLKYALSWGLPILVAVLAAIVNAGSNAGLLGQTENGACWAEGFVLTAFFIVPFALAFFAGVVSFVVLLYAISQLHTFSLGAKNKSVEQLAVIVLLLLLGLTWLFAHIAITQDEEGYQWLFAICAVTQGLYFFLTQVALNEDAVSLWRQTLHLSTTGNMDMNRERKRFEIQHANSFEGTFKDTEKGAGEEFEWDDFTPGASKDPGDADPAVHKVNLARDRNSRQDSSGGENISRALAELRSDRARPDHPARLQNRMGNGKGGKGPTFGSRFRMVDKDDKEEEDNGGIVLLSHVRQTGSEVQVNIEPLGRFAFTDRTYAVGDGLEAERNPSYHKARPEGAFQNTTYANTMLQRSGGPHNTPPPTYDAAKLRLSDDYDADQGQYDMGEDYMQVKGYGPRAESTYMEVAGDRQSNYMEVAGDRESIYMEVGASGGSDAAKRARPSVDGFMYDEEIPVAASLPPPAGAAARTRPGQTPHGNRSTVL